MTWTARGQSVAWSDYISRQLSCTGADYNRLRSSDTVNAAANISQDRREGRHVSTHPGKRTHSISTHYSI